MELYQIRHFSVVAETGSFTKAATRASASIAELEEEPVVKLFHRSPKSVMRQPERQASLNGCIPALINAQSPASGKLAGDASPSAECHLIVASGEPRPASGG
jgi:DNA-binding transcriptional LysR family regulator